MKIVKADEDFCCPNCNAKLQVEDSDYFESDKPMQRNDSFWMECPECGAVYGFDFGSGESWNESIYFTADEG